MPYFFIRIDEVLSKLPYHFNHCILTVCGGILRDFTVAPWSVRWNWVHPISRSIESAPIKNALAGIAASTPHSCCRYEAGYEAAMTDGNIRNKSMGCNRDNMQDMVLDVGVSVSSSRISYIYRKPGFSNGGYLKLVCLSLLQESVISIANQDSQTAVWKILLSLSVMQLTDPGPKYWKVQFQKM